MKIIKLILLKIANGFLAGLGLAVALAIFYWGAYIFFQNKSEDFTVNETGNSDCRSFKKCEKETGLTVKILSERASSEEFVLLGEVSNSGDIDWTSVNLKAELFDENETFIEECTHYINEKVFPQSKVNFKLNCSKCSKIQLENYSSYKISIVDASTY